MKGLKKFALLPGTAAAVTAWLVAPGIAGKKKKEPFMHQNIAHRGLHTEDKTVPENSLPAFKAAVAKGYGVELDVQLSSDGYVVVFHDDTLNRVCGVDSRVDAKTLAELKELRLCGTDETIPLFSEVLEAIGGKTPIICELKTGPNNKELCRKTLEFIRSYEGSICIESFDPTIVAWFRFNAPDLLRGQLADRPSAYRQMFSAPLPALLGNCLMNFAARPQFIAYNCVKKPVPVRLSEMMGAMRFCWTSHDTSHEDKNDTVIFEFYTPSVKFGE